MSTTTNGTVRGMTCDHCVRSVEEEVATVAGVTDVRADLSSGALTVTSDGPLDPAALEAAVIEAGYELGP